MRAWRNFAPVAGISVIPPRGLPRTSQSTHPQDSHQMPVVRCFLLVCHHDSPQALRRVFPRASCQIPSQQISLPRCPVPNASPDVSSQIPSPISTLPDVFFSVNKNIMWGRTRSLTFASRFYGCCFSSFLVLLLSSQKKGFHGGSRDRSRNAFPSFCAAQLWNIGSTRQIRQSTIVPVGA